jgi:hypothetical protein
VPLTTSSASFSEFRVRPETRNLKREGERTGAEHKNFWIEFAPNRNAVAPYRAHFAFGNKLYLFKSRSFDSRRVTRKGISSAVNLLSPEEGPAT